MGIKGLKALIKKHVPEAISALSNLSGKTICVDSSILLYKFRHIYNQDNFHILGFLHETIRLLEQNIKVIYVFDGKPPDAKRGVLNKRKEQNIKSKEQLEFKIAELKELKIDDAFMDSDSEDSETVNNSKLLNLQRKLISIKPVTRNHSLEVIEMLKTIGIPFFASDGEAEEACVFLQTHGYADYIVTEDTDSLTFGGENVLFKSKTGYDLYELNKILKGLDLNQDEFIDLCILCGCDYTCTIPKVGPVTALTLIKQHRSIENILNFKTAPESFDYQIARNLFKAQNITFKETAKFILANQLFLAKRYLSSLSNLQNYLPDKKFVPPIFSFNLNLN